jgi:hypothetical protein
MGCDIHVTIQYRTKLKTSDSNYWYTFAQDMELPRDYDMFATLAGVRVPNQYSLKPKGMPNDAELPKSLYTDSEFYSHSWVSYKEYKRVLKNYSRIYDFSEEILTPHVEYLILFDIMKSFKKKKMESRLIFWFDS